MRHLLLCAAFICGLATTAQAESNHYFYGKEKLQDMIVTVPPHAKNAPIMVMVHGGAWMLGDMTDVTVSEPKRSYWAQPEKGGFLFVSVNYRLTPEATAYEQAEDVAHAVQFVQAHAGEWGGDASRMVLMGHSAGGHLVTLLGANPTKFGLKPWAATVSLDSAAYDVRKVMSGPHFPYYDPAFGSDPAAWDEASPLAQLQKNATPFFLACTPQGPFLCSEARRFAEAAHKLGVAATVRSDDYEHVELNNAVGESVALTYAIDDFIHTYLPLGQRVSVSDAALMPATRAF